MDYNFQVMLRSKYVFNYISYFLENCAPDDVEIATKKEFNLISNFGRKFKVLLPNGIKQNSLDDPSLYFIHVGKSTVNHSYEIPIRYQWIYEEQTESSPDYNLRLPNDFNLDDIIDADKSFRKDENYTIKEYIYFK